MSVLELRYQIKAGDTLTSIAKHFEADSWSAVYDYPKNGEFRKRNPNPKIVAIGEWLIVPVSNTPKKSSNGSSTNVPTGGRPIVSVPTTTLVFDPKKFAYVAIPAADVVAFNKELGRLDYFRNKFYEIINNKSYSSKMQARHLRTLFCTLKEYLKITDPKKASDYIAKYKEHYDTAYKSETASAASPIDMESGEVVHYYHGQKKRSVWVSQKMAKPGWQSFAIDKEKLNRQIADKNNASAPKESRSKRIMKAMAEKPSGKSKLFEKELFKLESDNEIVLLDEQFLKDNEQFDGSLSANLGRWSCDGKVDITADLKNKRLSLGSVSGSFNLADAKGTFSIGLPHKDGFDVLQLLRDMKIPIASKTRKQLYMKVEVAFEGSAFVGACGNASLDIGMKLAQDSTPKPVKKSPKLPPLNAKAEFSVFVGAKASIEVALSLMTKIYKTEESAEATEWTKLASVKYGAYAAAGFGVDAALKLYYMNGKFMYMAKIGVVVKLGAGTKFEGEVDPLAIGMMIWTIASVFEWKGLKTLFGRETLDDITQDFFNGVMASCLYTGKVVKDVAKEMLVDLQKLSIGVRSGTYQALESIKSVDDTFDRMIPGYSGYKKVRIEFWILKSAYQVFAKMEQKYSLSDRTEVFVNSLPPSRWKYATWQMKANLIHDLATGDSNAVPFIGGELKEEAIIKVLRTIRHSDEFKDINKFLLENRVNLDNELDYGQQEEYTRIKTKFLKGN